MLCRKCFAATPHIGEFSGKVTPHAKHINPLVLFGLMEIKIDKRCETLPNQMQGLMFSKKRTLLFVFKKPRRISLHNFFVFFPINLIFLDDEKRVIEIRKNFLPFTLYASKVWASYLIETPFDIDADVGEKLLLS